MTEKPKCNSRIMTGLLLLQQFNFVMRYVAGSENVGDCLFDLVMSDLDNTVSTTTLPSLLTITVRRHSCFQE
jgi:hypothetical protein